MGRPRKNNKHLPRGMHFKHGAYYHVRGNTWTRLGKHYGPALIQFGELIGKPAAVRTVREAMWSAIDAALTRTHKRPISEATAKGYRFSAQRLEPVFGDLALEDLEADMLVKYLIEGGTVAHNRDRALLSIAYTHARNSWRYKGPDPTKLLQVRVEETPRDRYVTDGELGAIIDKASPKLACIARFLELTGMRQSDALRITLADLDDAGFDYWNGKSKKRQGLVWSPELRAVVDEANRLWRRFGREFLFESRPKGKHAKRGPGPYTPSGLRALWRKPRERAGLKDVTLHDLRGKAGSDAASDEAAQRLLGHADAKVTRRHYRRRVDRGTPGR